MLKELQATWRSIGLCENSTGNLLNSRVGCSSTGNLLDFVCENQALSGLLGFTLVRVSVEKRGVSIFLINRFLLMQTRTFPRSGRACLQGGLEFARDANILCDSNVKPGTTYCIYEGTISKLSTL